MTIANKVLHVVAAAIFNKQGNILIAQRPGQTDGKVEAGEAVTDALCRELDEGLGIHPLSWEPLISIVHAYPEKTVMLDVTIVRDLHGEALGREGQAARWVVPNILDQFDLPKANHGVIEALNILKRYSGNIVILPTF